MLTERQIGVEHGVAAEEVVVRHLVRHRERPANVAALKLQH